MTDDLIQVDFMLHTFDGKQYLANEDAEQMAALIETGSRIDGELRAEIKRLRTALELMIPHVEHMVIEAEEAAKVDTKFIRNRLKEASAVLKGKSDG